MKKLLSLLTFMFVFAAIAPAQQTIDAVGLKGTLVGPDGTPVTGHLTVALNLGGVRNICTTPYTTVPRGPITFTVTNGVIVNGSTAKLITQDCMSPRSAYYISLYNQQNKMLFADNWYLRQQAIVNSVRAQDVGALVEQGFSGPIQVAIDQAVVTNPVGNQTITQPAGTNLIINSAICTGTCIGFGGGGGSGGGVSSVGLNLPSDIFNITTSPITSAGNLTAALATQAANSVFAGPCTGSDTTPNFRVLCSGDIPNNAANTTGTANNVTGIVAIANGGTGTATPGLVGGTGVTITGSWPNQTVTSMLVGSGSPTQLAVYGSSGALGGDPNVTDSGSLITFGTTINMSRLSASLCVATDGSKNLVSVTCGSSTPVNGALQFPALGSIASATTVDFGAQTGYAVITGTATIATIVPYAGCSGGTIACVYAVTSSNGFSIKSSATGGTTNNINTANGVGSVTPTIGGNVYFFIYDTTNGLWHMTDGQVPSIWAGVWSNTNTYNPGQLVSYQGQTFISLQQLNTGNIPPASSSFWTAIGLACGQALCLTNPSNTIALASNQTFSATTAVLTSIGNMSATGGCFFIDAEWECYAYSAGNTLFGITRGAYNTTAVAHTTTSITGVNAAMALTATGNTAGIVIDTNSSLPTLGINNSTPGWNPIHSCCDVLDINSGTGNTWFSSDGTIHQIGNGNFPNGFPNQLYAPLQISSLNKVPTIASSGDVLQASGVNEAFHPIGFGGGIAGSVTVGYTSMVGAPIIENESGPTGSQTRTYVCAATDYDGNLITGTAASITNAPTAITSGFISITCPWSAGIASFQVYRTVGGPSQGLLSSQSGINGLQVFDFDTATTGGSPPSTNMSNPKLTVVGNIHNFCDTTTSPNTCMVLAAGVPTGCGTTYGLGSTYNNETGSLGTLFFVCSPPGTPYNVGTQVETTTGTGANTIFNLYTKTSANSGGYSVLSASIYVGTGGTSGDHIDVGLVTAPTATTQGSSWLCHGTYTETSSAPNGWVSVALTGCGTLSPNTFYWIVYDTNDAGVQIGRYNCSSSCSGAAGTSSYGGFSVAATYGTYTGMTTTLSGPAATQGAIFITLQGISNEWVPRG